MELLLIPESVVDCARLGSGGLLPAAGAWSADASIGSDTTFFEPDGRRGAAQGKKIPSGKKVRQGAGLSVDISAQR